MMLVDVAFWLFAVVAVSPGALVFVVDSMARATYALAVSFVAVGLPLLLLQQDYVGVVDDPDDGHGDGRDGRLHGHVHGDEPGADADEHGAQQPHRRSPSRSRTFLVLGGGRPARALAHPARHARRRTSPSRSARR